MTMWKDLVSNKQPNEVTYQYALSMKGIPFRIRASIIRRFRKGVKDACRKIKTPIDEIRKEKKRCSTIETKKKEKRKRLPKRISLPNPERGELSHGSKHNYVRREYHEVLVHLTSRGRNRTSRKPKIQCIPRSSVRHLTGPQGLWHDKGEQDA